MVKLIGEGEYNLDALKEIKVTDSYLGLDENVRGCQNKESLDNCKTKHYIETLLQKCGCLPFSIILTRKGYPICSSEKLECMKSININPIECLHPCSGLILSSFTKSVESKDLESLISRKITTYRNYTKWFEFPSGIKGDQSSSCTYNKNFYLLKILSGKIN